MKVEELNPTNFTPYSIIITVESEEDQEAIKRIGAANVRIPDLISSEIRSCYSKPGVRSEARQFLSRLFEITSSKI